MRVQPQRHRSWAGFTALHLVQPVDGGVAAVVTDLAGAQTAAGDAGRRRLPRRRHPRRECPRPGRRGPGVAGDPRTRARTRPTRCGRSSRLVGQVRPDLIHAHSAKAGLAGRLAVRGRVPTVFQPHAWSFEAVGGTTGRPAPWRWERWATRWTDRVVCVSEAERRTGERAGIDACWSVVRNGVDLDQVPAGATARTRRGRRAALPLLAGLPPTAPVVICVGRLCPSERAGHSCCAPGR